MTWRGKPN